MKDVNEENESMQEKIFTLMSNANESGSANDAAGSATN